MILPGIASFTRQPLFRPFCLRIRPVLLAAFALALAGAGLTPADARQHATFVLDAQTGVVLHAENAELKNRPASLTKLMTLYLTFEALRDGRLTLDRPLPVSKFAASQPPTKINLKAGSNITVQNAILAALTKSANDAAVVLAEALGGTETAFAAKMTAKAQSLGMHRTQFRNASGLPNEQQVTTARDMAILANALYTDFPQYSHYFATQQFRWSGNVYRNHNRLLGTYGGVDGIKTGYTNASGFNLVTSVRRDGRHVFAVVMGGSTSYARDAQMRLLLDRTFGESGHEALAVTVQKDRINIQKNSQPIKAAAVKPAAKPFPPKRWSVQVGTFKAHARAQATAQQAKRVAPSLLKPAGIKIETVNKSNKVLYRARFTGLTEESARQTCRVLTSKRFSCLAIQIG